MATRKTYTHDFKLDAVKLVTERGLSRARVARDLGIGTQTLRNWLRALAANPPRPRAPTPSNWPPCGERMSCCPRSATS